MEATQAEVIRQHLIDPEICIRCNTCESTCPVGAITHDSRNYVVDANICNLCMACVPPCPTGSIDNWRQMPRRQAYSIEAQFGWDALPAELSLDELGGSDASNEAALTSARSPQATLDGAGEEAAFEVKAYAAVIPPWSAMLGSPKQAKTTTPITSYSISARCRFRCLKAIRSAYSLPASTQTDERLLHRNLLSADTAKAR